MQPFTFTAAPEHDDDDDRSCEICDELLEETDDHIDYGLICPDCAEARKPKLGVYPFEGDDTGLCDRCEHITLNLTADDLWRHQACEAVRR